MMQSCTQSALVLVRAARPKRLTFLPESLESGVGKLIQIHRYWKGEAKDAADRLTILDELVKDIGPFSLI